jgi:Trp operon repressor
VIKESQWLYFFARNNNEEETKQKISELVEIFESLTPEEIAVLKNKLKILANNLINEYSPSEIKNSLEIRQFINS